MYVVLFITVSSRKEAKLIASALLKDRLAACVNIADKIDSFFWWQGKIDCAKELLMVVKSRKDKVGRIIKKVKSLHSYTVPEIIALPICAGDKPYLKWIDESLR
jgi:periplasmic divalent cation tolerance protein